MRPFVALAPLVFVVACASDGAVESRRGAVEFAESEPGLLPSFYAGEGEAPDYSSYVAHRGVGEMTGRVGGLDGIDAPLWQSTVWTSKDNTEFALEQTKTGWAMLMGGFDRSLLSPEGTATLGEGEHWVLGCSGPSAEGMDFDEFAETVSVVEVVGLESTALTLSATFVDGGELTVQVVYEGE